jgi:hypothetical protein
VQRGNRGWLLVEVCMKGKEGSKRRGSRRDGVVLGWIGGADGGALLENAVGFIF